MAKVTSDSSKNHRPFVCGLCMLGFDKIDRFHTHFKKHCDIIKRECFHICDLTELQQLPRREVVIGSDLQIGTFTCMGCAHAFPTICQLHKHLAAGPGTSGSYVVDIKSSSALPTLHECPDNTKYLAERENKNVRRRLRTRKNNKLPDESQTLEKGNSSEISNEVPTSKANIADIATKNLNHVTNENNGDDNEVEAELTFEALHHLPTKECISDEFSKLSNDGMLKCMVKFKSLKKLFDKGCQVNMPENVDWTDSSVTYLKESEHRSTNAKRKRNEDLNKKAIVELSNLLNTSRNEIKLKNSSCFTKSTDSCEALGVISEHSLGDHTHPVNESTSPDDTCANHDTDTATHKEDDRDISDKNAEGDDDDDYVDDENETNESNMEPAENRNTKVYPEHEFVSETVGKRKFLFCEVCNKKYEQCLLIRHIEESHNDDDLSEFFRQKLLKLTLVLENRKMKKKKSRGGKRTRFIQSSKGSVLSFDHSDSINPTELGLDKRDTYQGVSQAGGRTADDNNKTMKRLETDVTANELSLKSVFRKIDKKCTQQAVKTTKKKFYPCKICGVLIENCRLQEHKDFHNTKAGKLLFSQNNLEECKMCGRVLLKRSLAKHTCLLLNADGGSETDSTSQAEQTSSAPANRGIRKLKRKSEVKKLKAVGKKDLRHGETPSDADSVENIKLRHTQNAIASSAQIDDLSEETDLNVLCTDEANISSFNSNLESEDKRHPSERSEAALKTPANTAKSDSSRNIDFIKKYFADRSTNSDVAKPCFRRKKFVACKQCGMYVKYDRLKCHNDIHQKYPERFAHLVECEQCGRKLFQKNFNRHICASGLKVSLGKFKRRHCEESNEMNKEKQTLEYVGTDDEQCTSHRKVQSKDEKEIQKISKEEGRKQRWLCYECGKSFKTERTFISHRDRKHKLLVFMCHICMKMLNTAAALEQHVKIHSVIQQHESEQANLLLKTARVEHASRSPGKSTSPNTNTIPQNTASHCQGLQATGVLATGVLTTGVQATGLKATGLQATGVQATGVQSTGLQATGVWIPGQEDTEKAVQSILVDTSHHDLMISPSPTLNFSNNTIENSSF